MGSCSKHVAWLCLGYVLGGDNTAQKRSQSLRRWVVDNILASRMLIKSCYATTCIDACAGCTARPLQARGVLHRAFEKLPQPESTECFQPIFAGSIHGRMLARECTECKKQQEVLGIVLLFQRVWRTCAFLRRCMAVLDVPEDKLLDGSMSQVLRRILASCMHEALYIACVCSLPWVHSI